MNDNEKAMPTLASEIYSDLKQEIRFKNKLIFVLIGIVCALIIALAATNVYHIYQWSQFDTIVVDSGENGGDANLVQHNGTLVQGDNIGGINNGPDSSTNPQEGEVQGD